jgi:hypothetical protein
MHHTTGRFHRCTIEALGDSVLLRGVWDGSLMHNTFCSEEVHCRIVRSYFIIVHHIIIHCMCAFLVVRLKAVEQNSRGKLLSLINKHLIADNKLYFTHQVLSYKHMYSNIIYQYDTLFYTRL